jgi:tetratricopeptide (TPR) repeat protein
VIEIQPGRKHAASCVAALIAGCLFLTLIGCETTSTSPPPSALQFPAPYAGPGHPDLESSALRHIKKGWLALQRGDTRSARAAAQSVGVNSATTLLTQQAAIVGGDGEPIPVLQNLLAESPDYSSAWLTLSVAAENADSETVAYEAAKRGAELWPDQRWLDRAADLNQRWVGDRVTAARELLESGQAASALETLAPALEIEPDHRDAILLKARALIAEGQVDLAETTLIRLPQDPDALFLSGKIAESRGDWQIAMSLYSAMPEDHPERAFSLNRAQLRWRISMMPPYVRDAMTTQELDRAGLATILVSLVPRLETIGGGEVPVMTDIVASEARREILTAVRLGLLHADPVDHLFHPKKPVAASATRRAIDELCTLLALDHPPWCSSSVEGRCIDLDQPVNGARVTGLVIGLVERGGG